jgi:hypothetical protein
VTELLESVPTLRGSSPCLAASLDDYCYCSWFSRDILGRHVMLQFLIKPEPLIRWNVTILSLGKDLLSIAKKRIM